MNYNRKSFFLDALLMGMPHSGAVRTGVAMDEKISVLVFGACLLHGPLNPLHRMGGRFAYANYGPTPGTYTFGEIFQAIGVLRGEREVPQELRSLCNMRPNFRPVARSADFSDVDVVLLEPSSPI